MTLRNRDDLYERPGSEFVAGFMGEAMLFDGLSLPDGSVQLGPIELPRERALVAGKVKVAVRAEASDPRLPKPTVQDVLLMATSLRPRFGRTLGGR